MSDSTGYVLAIAGHDPSGGAGILADVQAITRAGALPLAVCTAVTYQTHNRFHGFTGLSLTEIKRQLLPLLENYPIVAIKIGLFTAIYDLCEILKILRESLPAVPIVWDPVLKTSSGYIFHDMIGVSEMNSILKNCTVVTPNRDEVCVLSGFSCPDKSAKKLSEVTPILLKGGHDQGDMIVDKLYSGDLEEVFRAKRCHGVSKHGSGCLHSSTLASYLGQGASLVEASRRTFDFMQEVFRSNDTSPDSEYVKDARVPYRMQYV